MEKSKKANGMLKYRLFFGSVFNSKTFGGLWWGLNKRIMKINLLNPCDNCMYHLL
jgi:hypothetical protein